MGKLSEDLALIALHLKKAEALEDYAGKQDPPEHETAYAIYEIAESAQRICDIWYPKLRETSNPQVCLDAVQEFREEIRHVLYHIEDSEFLSVVKG